MIGGAEAVALLQQLMREDRDYELRLIAARALRVVGGDDAAWELIRGLRDDVLPTDRILEQLGRPFAAHALLQALQIADFNDVRAHLAEALGLAAYAPAAHALGGLVRFGNERERTKACRALGRLGDPIVVPAPDARDGRRVVGRARPGGDGARRLRHSRPRSPRSRARSPTRTGGCGRTAPRACASAATPVSPPCATPRANHPDRYARDRALEALALEAASARHAVAA